MTQKNYYKRQQHKNISCDNMSFHIIQVIFAHFSSALHQKFAAQRTPLPQTTTDMNQPENQSPPTSGACE